MGEEYRDQKWLPLLDSLRQDLKFTLRQLLREKSFTVVALGSLALGIGANTAIFSVVNTVLFRTLPYPQPETLVQLERGLPGPESYPRFTGREWEFIRENATSYESIASTMAGTGVNLIAGNRVEYISLLKVTADFFHVLRVPPFPGQSFERDAERVGSEPVAIISYPLWIRFFSKDPEVLEQTVNLAGTDYRVIGVMPEGFEIVPATDIFLPLQPSPADGGTNRSIVARLKDGVTRRRAQTELTGFFQQINEQLGREVQAGRGFWIKGYQGHLAREIHQPLLIFFGAVGLVLLVTCVNLANLLLARATSRSAEMAMRATLGAGRSRLVRQLLIEALVLSLTGGALGVLMAYMGLPAFLSLAPFYSELLTGVQLDGLVLFFALAVSMGTALVFGLIPSVRAARVDLSEACKDAARGGSTGHARFRKALVVAEVALSLILLVGALLLARTFLTLMSVDPGFDPKGVITAQMSMRGSRYDSTNQVVSFYRQALQRLQSRPEIEQAAIILNRPLQFGMNLPVYFDSDDPRQTDWRYVTGPYFELMGIELFAGRYLGDRDIASSIPVAVVNQEFSDRYFPGQHPVGGKLQLARGFGEGREDRPREIVGVVEGSKQSALSAPVPPTVYVPAAQVPDGLMHEAHGYFPVNWLVRAGSDVGSLAALVRDEVGAIDPYQPFSRFESMNEAIDNSVSRQRFQMFLLGAFGILTVGLAAAGVFGVVSYTAAQRMHELGIRMAIGATRARVCLLMIKQAVCLPAIGVFLGLVGAFFLSQVLESVLFGIGPRDPVSFVLAGIGLFIVTFLCGLIPAGRVLSLNPAQVLRRT